jgi:poly-gamma-glutamate synthesis protein (capsule biosynthesis protein)
MATLALAGDTMLGRSVADALRANPRAPLVAADVAEQIASADAFVLNLECCISDRGSPFPDPAKPFFFRAPPVAAERVAELGVDAVTLANNHALDYGEQALLDTIEHLEAAGVATVGAGADENLARAPAIVRCGSLRLRLVAFSDHPAAYAAGRHKPGISYVDSGAALPGWAHDAVRPGTDADAVIVTPHWGPNMVAEPTGPVRRAADALLESGATLVAGHSAHVFQGVAPRILFDLGDFLDDYAVDRRLRNDLGLLWLVDVDRDGPSRIRALPLALDYCFTRRAAPGETRWIERRLRSLCAPFGTEVHGSDGLLELDLGAARGVSGRVS